MKTKRALSTSKGIAAPFSALDDSKSLYPFLSTQYHSVDKSIRADLDCIQFECKVDCVSMTQRLPGSVSLEDPGTKDDIHLCQEMDVLIHTREIKIAMTKHESGQFSRSNS